MRGSFEGSTGEEIAASLRAARAHEARLRRRQGALTAASIAGLALLAARGIVGIFAPSLHPARSSAALGGALAAGLVACLVVLALALRARRRLEALREEIFSLEFLAEVVDHDAALIVRTPYRSRQRPRVLVVPDAERPAEGASPSERSRAWVGLGGVVAASAVALLLALVGGRADPERRRWMFTEAAASADEIGFATPIPSAGRWLLQDHDQATGARALVNHAGLPGERPATALAGAVRARDVRAVTRCKVATERADQACGLVFRYRDAENHYVARLDAAAGSVVLGVVSGGVERVIRRERAEIAGGVWQELAVEARGDRIAVAWNGRRLIDGRDATLAGAGAVGLWAPAEGVAWFDELAVEALESRGHLLLRIPAG